MSTRINISWQEKVLLDTLGLTTLEVHLWAYYTSKWCFTISCPKKIATCLPSHILKSYVHLPFMNWKAFTTCLPSGPSHILKSYIHLPHILSPRDTPCTLPFYVWKGTCSCLSPNTVTCSPLPPLYPITSTSTFTCTKILSKVVKRKYVTENIQMWHQSKNKVQNTYMQIKLIQNCEKTWFRSNHEIASNYRSLTKTCFENV